MNTKLKIISLVALGFILIALFGISILWLMNFLRTQDQLKAQQILGQIIQNNPQLSASGFANRSGVATDAASLSIRAPGIFNPLGLDNNYSHSLSTYTPGPALASCPAMAYGGRSN